MNKSNNKLFVIILILVFLFILLGFAIRNGNIIEINNSINHAFEKIQSTFFVMISKIISDLFESVGVLIITMAASIYLFLKKRWKEAIVLIVIVGLSSASVAVLKNIYENPRPSNALVSETDFSFPSGHASIAVVLFGLLAYIYLKEFNKNKSGVISIAILGIVIVSLSRLYLSVHWFTDIIGGLIIGDIWLVIGIIGLNK